LQENFEVPTYGVIIYLFLAESLARDLWSWLS